jgi:hypothetical protein
MGEEITKAVTVNIKHKPGYTGMLVGQCREVPFFIAEAKNVEELIQNVFYEPSN